jgi:hypothetical protein
LCKDANVQSIKTYEDFAVDLKEREVIEICKSANIITDGAHKILVEKLGKRNSAAGAPSFALFAKGGIPRLRPAREFTRRLPLPCGSGRAP